MKKQSRRQASKYLFAGALSSTLLGCSKFEGVGSDPGGIEPQISVPVPHPVAMAFGITVDFYGGGKFRIDGDPRKYLLRGMYFAKFIGQRTARSGANLVDLFDHLRGESFTMKVAAGAIARVKGIAQGRSLEMASVDIAAERAASGQVTIEFADPTPDLVDISPVNSLAELKGEWSGDLPNGSRFSLILGRKFSSKNSLSMESRNFGSDSVVKISTAERLSTGQTQLAGYSTVTHLDRFEPMPLKSEVKIVANSDRSMLLESTYHEWDSKGFITDRRWWPCQLERTG